MINYREKSWIQRTCKHPSESQFNSKWLIFPFTSLVSNDDSATLDDHSKGLSRGIFGEKAVRFIHSFPNVQLTRPRNQQKHEIFHTKKREAEKKRRGKPPDREGKRRNYFYAPQNLIFHSLSRSEQTAPQKDEWILPVDESTVVNGKRQRLSSERENSNEFNLWAIRSLLNLFCCHLSFSSTNSKAERWERHSDVIKRAGCAGLSNSMNESLLLLLHGSQETRTRVEAITSVRK